jgi:hypothetical protein
MVVSQRPLIDSLEHLILESIIMSNEIDIPGTVHLVDVDHTMHTRHASKNEDIVLDPTPSSDPNDPLNWSPRRKLLSLICQNLYVIRRQKLRLITNRT